MLVPVYQTAERFTMEQIRTSTIPEYIGTVVAEQAAAIRHDAAVILALELSHDDSLLISSSQ